MHRDRQAGFTLLEVLVALAVLAVSASFLLSATESHARNTVALSDRMIALWVAQNAIVAQETGQAGDPATVSMGGIIWRVQSTFIETADPALLRVNVSVAPDAAPDAVLARLTTFIDAEQRP